jgi:hypothetical protein
MTTVLTTGQERVIITPDMSIRVINGRGATSGKGFGALSNSRRVCCEALQLVLRKVFFGTECPE